jgi:hypothetical protein
VASVSRPEEAVDGTLTDFGRCSPSLKAGRVAPKRPRRDADVDAAIRVNIAAERCMAGRVGKRQTLSLNFAQTMLDA